MVKASSAHSLWETKELTAEYCDSLRAENGKCGGEKGFSYENSFQWDAMYIKFNVQHQSKAQTIKSDTFHMEESEMERAWEEKSESIKMCYFRGRCIDFFLLLLLRTFPLFALTMAMVLGVFHHRISLSRLWENWLLIRWRRALLGSSWKNVVEATLFARAEKKLKENR